MKNIKLRIVYLILGSALLLFALFMLAVNLIIPAHFVREAKKALSISTLSKVTRGAAASKKFRYLLPGNSREMASDKASDVNGPEARMTFPASGISVTSPSTTVMLGWLLILSVMAWAKA